jgi:hypothetical protein
MDDDRKPQSPHFFRRQRDGSVRLRITIFPEEATLYEEAAGETPILDWVHQSLSNTARRQVAKARRQRPQIGPPEKGPEGNHQE